MKKLRNQSLETGNKEVQFERISAIVCIFDDQAQTLAMFIFMLDNSLHTFLGMIIKHTGTG